MTSSFGMTESPKGPLRVGCEPLQRWNQTSIARHLRCAVLTDDVEESIVRSIMDRGLILCLLQTASLRRLLRHWKCCYRRFRDWLPHRRPERWKGRTRKPRTCLARLQEYEKVCSIEETGCIGAHLKGPMQRRVDESCWRAEHSSSEFILNQGAIYAYALTKATNVRKSSR